MALTILEANYSNPIYEDMPLLKIPASDTSLDEANSAGFSQEAAEHCSRYSSIKISLEFPGVSIPIFCITDVTLRTIGVWAHSQGNFALGWQAVNHTKDTYPICTIKVGLPTSSVYSPTQLPPARVFQSWRRRTETCASAFIDAFSMSMANTTEIDEMRKDAWNGTTINVEFAVTTHFAAKTALYFRERWAQFRTRYPGLYRTAQDRTAQNSVAILMYMIDTFTRSLVENSDEVIPLYRNDSIAVESRVDRLATETRDGRWFWCDELVEEFSGIEVGIWSEVLGF